MDKDMLFFLAAGLLPLWLIGLPVCLFHRKQCLSKPTCTASNKRVTVSVLRGRRR